MTKREIFIITSILITICSISINCLSNEHESSLILKGQLDNSSAEKLVVIFEDQNYVKYADTIYLKDNGEFNFELENIFKPQSITVLNGQNNKYVIRHLFVAPGYDLTIKADFKDSRTVSLSKKITGVGSESNLYHVLLDSIIASREDVRFTRLSYPEFQGYLAQQIGLRDSISNIVFEREAIDDNFLPAFEAITRKDIQFFKFTLLLNYMASNDFPVQKKIDVINKEIDKELIENIYDESNLTSWHYRNWIIKYEYLRHIIDVDFFHNPSLHKEPGYVLRKIDTTYIGVVRDFTYFSVMSEFLQFCTDYSILLEMKPILQSHISKINNIYYRNTISKILVNKDSELRLTMNGKTVPLFSMEDSKGVIHNISDYFGKVVYIDFWATWCGPCLKESPYMENLYERYKGNSDFQLISICVNDSKPNWHRYLQGNNVGWLQLFDEKSVSNKHFNTFSIPRFILIDKQGKIVSFDAPRPSSGIKIEELIDLELEK